MDAQARVLRERASAAGVPAAATGAAPARRLARTVAVASGKGGVGKSTIALGVAMAAAERGVRTLLVDGDLGMANLDILAGVRPAHSSAQWMAGRVRLAECVAPVAPRLWLLGGASGIARMADLDAAHRQRLLDGLSQLATHVELMVVDLGAGIGTCTLDLACAAEQLLVVATPEPTAMADAYAFIKACVHHGGASRIACVASMTDREADGRRAVGRLAGVARTHLGVQVADAGVVPRDDAVRQAVQTRTPLLRSCPASPAARAMRRVESAVAASLDGGAGGSTPAGGGQILAAMALRFGLRLGSRSRAAG
jgi:flagellar biosynthesis protein FlhG